MAVGVGLMLRRLAWEKLGILGISFGVVLGEEREKEEEYVLPLWKVVEEEATQEEEGHVE